MKGGRKMRKDEILNASPEQLRELVAVHVMEWEKRHSPDPTIWSWKLPDGTGYATGYTAEAWLNREVGDWVENMDHARQVAKRMIERGWYMIMTWYDHATCVEFHHRVDSEQIVEAWGKEPERAICRAALLVVMGATA